MKRTLASVAAAGLLTFGLAACGSDEPEVEEPAEPAAEETTDEATEEETTEESTEEETTEEPTEEETTEEATTEEPTEEETTEAPGDGGESSAPEAGGDAAEWCMGLAELGQGGFDPSVFTEDPDQAIQLLEDLREGAPEPVAGNLDVMIENLDAALAGDLENVDQEALMDATTEFQTNVMDACSGAM